MRNSFIHLVREKGMHNNFDESLFRINPTSLINDIYISLIIFTYHWEFRSCLPFTFLWLLKKINT